MTEPLSPDPLERRRLLSALADGEDDAAAGCALWSQDAAARSDWHLYHLIGDVLRADDLAHSAARDERLLDGVRKRLESEPVVLAPMPTPAAAVPAPRRRRFRWLAPTAAAAGFAAVAGMLVVTRVEAPLAPAGQLAGARAPLAGAVPTAVIAVTPAPASLSVREREMIRDARLDSYLRAHREGVGGVSVAVPGGALRSVETIVPQR